MKSVATIRFGSTDTAHGSKQVQIGELLTAVNVRQTSKKGVYAKRAPFKKTAPTYSGGTVGTVDCACAGADGSILMRDRSDQLWSYGAAGAKFTLRGTIPQTFASWRQSMATTFANTATVHTAATSTQVWQFVNDSANSRILYSVFDTTTGVELASAVSVSQAATNISVVSDGTSVWLFVSSGTHSTLVFKTYKFDPAAPTTVPSAVTYHTPTYHPFSGATDPPGYIHAMYLPVTAKIAVVCCYSRDNGAGSGTLQLHRAYLDTATGQPAASPAAVELNDGTGTSTNNVKAIIASPKAGVAPTTWMVVYEQEYHLRLLPVATSDLSTTGAVVLEDGSTDRFLDTVAYYDGSTTTDVYQKETATLSSYDYNLTRWRSVSGTVTKTTNWARACTLQSEPIYDTTTSDWYAVTGYDDTSATATAGFQRCLHLRRLSDGVVMAQIATGEVGFFNTCKIVSSGGYWWLSYMAQAPVGAVFSPALAKITPIRTTTYSQLCQVGDKAIVPGGLPAIFSATDNARELTPLLYPSYITAAGGSGTGPTAVAALYSYTDADGTVYRSSPIVSSGTISAGATITIPTLRHGPGAANARIELYASVSGGQLQYQTSVANNTAADTVTWTETHATGGETIYTAGGGLSAANLPPVQAIGYWHNRVFAAAGNTLWFSQELESGGGPRFNEILRVTWSDVNDPITAICPIDWNYCAIFSKNAIAVLSGPGPDGIGKGNYELQTLSANVGCTNPKSVTNGPPGCFFQESATGRFHVATPALQVAEACPGIRDWSTETTTSAGWVQAEKHVRFGTSNGYFFVIDVDNPTQGSPLGQGYRWDVYGLIPAAIVVDSTGPVAISSTGNLFRQNESKSAYWRDDIDASSSTRSYYTELWTGRIHPGDMMHDVLVHKIQLLGTKTSQNGITCKYYVYMGTTASKLATPVPYWKYINEAQAEDTLLEMSIRPGDLLRTDGFYLIIREMPASYPSATEGVAGFTFEGLAIEFTQRGGRLKALNTTDNIGPS